MPTLAVTPLPAPVGSVVAVTGSGFNNRRIRLLLDGVPTGDTFRASKAGSFTVGVAGPKSPATVSLVAEQQSPGGKWSMVARLAPLLTFTPPGGTPPQEPILTGVGASNITSTTALISWVTSISSDSRVEYDFDGPPYTLSGYYDAAIALSPVWYCRLGDTSGSTADAAVGTDGTYVGSPTLNAPGALGSDTNGAVTLSGSQYVTVPDHAAIDVGDVFSLVGWFKATGATSTFRYLISKGTNSFGLALHSNNTLYFQVTGVANLCNSGFAITDNGWHHAAVTKNGSTVRMYLDGVDVTNALGSGTASSNAVAMNLGRNVASAGESFTGSLDEWGVWNTALTAGNIATLYNARNGGGGNTYNPAMVTTHSILLTGLTPSTGYHYRVVSAGATATLTSGDQTFTSAAAADVTAPVISNLIATVVSTTSVQISWSLDEFGTGQVQYATNPSFVPSQFTVKETSFTHTTHVQTISGLTPGTTYYYRAISVDAAGNSATSATDEFDTLSNPTGPTTGFYGSAIAMDGLGNTRVGYTSQQSSYRFRASQSSALNSFLIYIIANGNTGYSNGTGGTLRARLRADDGTSNHYPTGANLATASITPGNPGSSFPVFTFSSPYTLVAGTLYHLHFDNTDASPTVNYVSLDGLWQELPVGEPKQPKFPGNTDFDQLFSPDNGASWEERTEATPILDITYANGQHQGVGYIEVSYDTGEIGEVNGTTKMIREAFTVTGASRTVTGVGVRMWRVSGGTDDVSVRLETSGGTEIETVTIPYTEFRVEATPPPGSNWTGAGSWGTATFASSHVLTTGSSYNFRVSCAAGSTYGMLVIRRGISYGFTSATYFTDGNSQKTTDGTNWSSLGRVNNQNNMQFYLTTTG